MSPYAISKASADIYLLYLNEAYDFPVTLLRNANTFGRTRSKHFVVESIITQMLENQDEIRLGNPNPKRDFEYVTNHVNSYMKCLKTDGEIAGEVFNFGAGESLSIRELVNKIRKMTGWDGETIWEAIPERPCEIPCIHMDCSKARKELGWKPEVSLEEGLKKTINYWRTKLQSENTESSK